MHYLAGSELAYQFGISDVVYGTGPTTKVDYALAPWVAALFNSGFKASLYVEPEGKAEENLGTMRGSMWINVVFPGWLECFEGSFFENFLNFFKKFFVFIMAFSFMLRNRNDELNNEFLSFFYA